MTGDTERDVRLTLIQDEEHYEAIFERALRRAKVSIWIASANLKDVHVEAQVGTRARASGRYVSAYGWLQELAQAGLDVRILHAGKPSGPLRQRIGEQGKARPLSMRACPRVHLKMVAVDGNFLYLGSANFTGAGIGAKAVGRRNFEAGIVTEDPGLLDAMQARFYEIWSGKACANCKLRRECPKPIDTLQAKKRPGGTGAPKTASAKMAAKVVAKRVVKR